MGKITGFKEFVREVPAELPPKERIKHYREFLVQLPSKTLQEQGARCMDCGVPFCQSGCPLGNIIPEWNDLVYHDDWQRALNFLHATNNFPEFTGRVCPAPCEEACVLGINEPAVTIKNIESAIIDRAFDQGWVQAKVPLSRTGKRVAVIGSGPAGLACADQLNQAGHWVTVFERADRIGGLLRYGIPDFKLEKNLIQRRVQLLEAEGIVFKTCVNVGEDISVEQLKRNFEALVICCGATQPRDLQIPGRELAGVHFAMEFLSQQNKRVAGDNSAFTSLAGQPNSWWFSKINKDILATGKNVIVIGGGDTGSDCVGTSNRQLAKTITQFELQPMPTKYRPDHQPWPFWPMRLRKSSSHEEGCSRQWSIATKSFNGSNGKIESLTTVNIEQVPGNPSQLREIPGSKKDWPADLVLLALGFSGPETTGLVEKLGVELTPTKTVTTDNHYMTSIPGIFACGDLRRGQSLVVWAISEGREAARGVDMYLMGSTRLPTKGEGDLPRV